MEGNYNFLLMWLVAFFLILLSCAPKVERVAVQRPLLTAKCPKVAYMKVTYCPTRYAYSDRIQHMSLIKVVSLETGKSLKISVRTNKRVKGLCIPRRYKYFMSRGSSFTGRSTSLGAGKTASRSVRRGLGVTPPGTGGSSTGEGQRRA